MNGANADGWQPIATAPRDGSPVLLWSERERAYHVLSFDSSPPPGWMSQSGDYVVFEEIDPLSHWMPLPSPPRARDAYSRSLRKSRVALCFLVVAAAVATGSLGMVLENVFDLLP